jgi:hypothetical protein
MNEIKLSVEELIFCFYSEGLFEQGIELKMHYYPEMTDKELEFMFQMTCHSLLSKEMLELVNNVYRLKKEYSPFIQALNDSIFSMRASKFIAGKTSEKSISLHFTTDGLYFHEGIHEGKVHQITKYETKAAMVEILNHFFELKGKTHSDPLFVMGHEDFEAILKAASENNVLDILGLLTKNDLRNELTEEFARDLIARNGLLDSVMKLKFDDRNAPELLDLAFIIPGAQTTWCVTGSITNSFTLNIASQDIIDKMVNSNSNSMLLA